ncbi:MAG: hypothetical protein LBE36_00730 [Flavobacteriaceae bacterium]|nr:hypothetical protein [Flavobacteriaceae bacterium]
MNRKKTRPKTSEFFEKISLNMAFGYSLLAIGSLLFVTLILRLPFDLAQDDIAQNDKSKRCDFSPFGGQGAFTAFCF